MANENNEVKDIRSSISFRSVSKKTTDSPSLPAPRAFRLKDYNWSNRYEMNGDTPLMDYDSVPKLILIERQPKKKVDWTKILSDLSALEDLPIVGAVTKYLAAGAETASQVAGSHYLNTLADKYSSSVSEANKLLDISDIENLIEGELINTYEIPFFNNMWLSSNTKDGWNIGSAMESAGKFGELLNDGFKMNILKSPQWSNNNNEAPGWDTEFYLMNDDLDALQQNFTFINALFPSTQWVRMNADDSITSQATDYVEGVSEAANKHSNIALGNLSLAFSKSPNVFNVECPGRFQQLFVAIDMNVEYVGNVRTMPLAARLPNIPMLTASTLFPDAYKVTLSARDLTPSCFNVYANYLMGNKTVRVAPTTGTSAPNRANLIG